MKINLFCTHKNYDVLTWRYVNLNKPDQKIVARIKCIDCGKIFERIITERSTMETFAIVYDDKFAL